MKNTAQLSLHHELLRPRFLSKSTPLLIMLHGFGSHEYDLFSMAHEFGNKMMVVSVRGPISLPWGGFAWYEIDFSRGSDKWTNVNQAMEALEKLASFIGECHEAYGTDPKNTILMGFSQGAILSYALAFNYPEMINKVVAMSGCLLPDIMPDSIQKEKMSHLEMFVSHGLQDEVIPVDAGRQAVEFLQKVGIPHLFMEYQMGHGINPKCLKDLREWFDNKGLR